MNPTDDFLQKRLIASTVVDLFQMFLGEHAGYFTTAQEVIDVLEEGFIDHMVLREYEANLLIFKGC